MLMREVTDRAQTLLEEADQGRWPQTASHDLLNYLHLEVLRQSGEQEWLVFGTAFELTDQSAQRNREQIEVRDAVDQLTQAVAGGEGVKGMTPRHLAAITRNLLTQLQALLTAETQYPGDLEGVPSAASLGAQPHEWYALTEGPTIELDKLRSEQGHEAVMGRLLRLRVGEFVELRSSTDPTLLLARLVGTDHAGYGVDHLESGPHLWRVQVARHTQ